MRHPGKPGGGCGVTAPSMEVWQQRQLNPVQLQFPSMLPKMWSGGDVQEWLEAQGSIYSWLLDLMSRWRQHQAMAL